MSEALMSTAAPVVEYGDVIACPFEGEADGHPLAVLGDGTWRCYRCNRKGRWLVCMGYRNHIQLRADSSNA